MQTRKGGLVTLVFLWVFWLFLTPSAQAAQVQLAWEAPATNTDGTPLTVAGYKLYYGQSSGTYSSVLDIGNQTTYTVTGLTAGST